MTDVQGILRDWEQQGIGFVRFEPQGGSSGLGPHAGSSPRARCASSIARPLSRPESHSARASAKRVLAIAERSVPPLGPPF